MVVRFEAPQSFRTLVDEFFETEVHHAHRGRPAIQVVEDEQQTTLSLELPGVRKDDVKITFEDGILTVSATRKATELPPQAKVILNERRLHEYRRSIRPSHDVETSQVTAQLSDGILTVILPKAEKAKARTIAVR